LNTPSPEALKAAVFSAVVGAGVAGFTYGALELRISDLDDLLPNSIEAMIVGLAFALASAPAGWAIIARAVLIVPIFFLYLSIFLGKPTPLPYFAAFIMAGLYALVLTALSSFLAERGRGQGEG
jgi:hypothetical protein